MSVRELGMPLIEDGDRMAYGGDQEWGLSVWHRRSGCGPTTGVNLCVWYANTRPSMRALYEGNASEVTRAEFAENIENMFRYITPGFMGFPYAEKFISRFSVYAHTHGAKLTGACCDKNASAEEMFAFVRRGIDEGDPVPLMMLHHHAPELEENQWHWVTVSGYDDDPAHRRLIVSNCGNREEWNADVLFDRRPGDVVRVLRFCEM